MNASAGTKMPRKIARPAEPRDRAQVDAALLVRLVDDAEDAGDPADRGREDEHDCERDEEAPQHVLVGHEVVPHGYFVP